MLLVLVALAVRNTAPEGCMWGLVVRAVLMVISAKDKEVKTEKEKERPVQ